MAKSSIGKIISWKDILFSNYFAVRLFCQTKRAKSSIGKIISWKDILFSNYFAVKLFCHN